MRTDYQYGRPSCSSEKNKHVSFYDTVVLESYDSQMAGFFEEAVIMFSASSIFLVSGAGWGVYF